MQISALNTKIKFQNNTTVIDEIGNHSNEWVDYYSCFATISGGSTKSEDEVAGTIVENGTLNFTIRYCDKVKNINSTMYKIIFQDEIYNIIAIDLQNLKKKSIKFICKKVDR